MELTKAELEQVLAEVTKEYEDLVKAETVAKNLQAPGSAGAPGSAKSSKNKAGMQGVGPAPTMAGGKDPFGALNKPGVAKEETSVSESSKTEKSKTMAKEETSVEESSKKPDAPAAQDPMPEGSAEKSKTLEKSALVKAEGDEGGEDTTPPGEDTTPKDGGGEGGGDSAPPQDAAPPMDAPAEEAPVADAPAQDMAGEQPGMMSDDSMSPEQLLELYSGLSPEHLAMHWMAASQALFQSMSQGEGAAPMDAAPPAPPAPGGMPPMAKSEKEVQEFEALKKNFEELKLQNETLEKKLEEVTDKLSKKLGMPVQNGVTSDTVIAKSEEVKEEKVITKSEIVDLLKSKAKEAGLSEADKAKVLKYTMNPSVTQELKDFLGLK